MVLPFLVGLGIVARAALPRLLPRILPFARRAVSRIGGFVVRKPIKTSAILLGGGFIAASPTARRTILTAPKSLVQTGQLAGARFETAIESEEPTSRVSRALKIGGTAGLIATAGVLASRAIRKKREATVARVPVAAIAASPIEGTPLPVISAAPSVTRRAPNGAVPSTVGAVEPEVVPKAKRRRRVPSKPLIAPVFVNQIQISTE